MISNYTHLSQTDLTEDKKENSRDWTMTDEIHVIVSVHSWFWT